MKRRVAESIRERFMGSLSLKGMRGNDREQTSDDRDQNSDNRLKTTYSVGMGQERESRLPTANSGGLCLPTSPGRIRPTRALSPESRALFIAHAWPAPPRRPYSP